MMENKATRKLDSIFSNIEFIREKKDNIIKINREKEDNDFFDLFNDCFFRKLYKELSDE